MEDIRSEALHALLRNDWDCQSRLYTVWEYTYIYTLYTTVNIIKRKLFPNKKEFFGITKVFTPTTAKCTTRQTACHSTDQ